MRWLILCSLAGLVACGDPKDDTAAEGLDPLGDEDGDGFTNAQEEQGGTDPFDAMDTPYAGGWPKDAECNDGITPTGEQVGDVAYDFELQDQHGELVSLYDFCNRVVLIEFAGFT